MSFQQSLEDLRAKKNVFEYKHLANKISPAFSTVKS